jgi:hypothetical protein
MQIHKALPEARVKPIQAPTIAVDNKSMRCIDLTSVWFAGGPQIWFPEALDAEIWHVGSSV